MKHTKGPWKIETHAGNVEVWHQDTHVTTINKNAKASYEITAMDVANAHLIAAAPEMLEALEKALHDLEALRLSSDEDDYPLEVVSYLDTYMLTMFSNAIRKAKGGA